MKHLIALLLLTPLPALAFADTFAAIAHSQSTGLWGAGFRQPTREAAERQALANCYANDCLVQVWASNSCAALVYGRDRWTQAPLYGWAYDRSILTARRLAFDYCFRRSTGCQLIGEICSN